MEQYAIQSFDEKQLLGEYVSADELINNIVNDPKNTSVAKMIYFVSSDFFQQYYSECLPFAETIE